ncbi:MAG TPA: hypothetical protein VMC85_20815 [Desulfomonilaceae bacterium]|nr:hypothetical protein [Desulfomonilaceae bacterium]
MGEIMRDLLRTFHSYGKDGVFDCADWPVFVRCEQGAFRLYPFRKRVFPVLEAEPFFSGPNVYWQFMIYSYPRYR